MPQFDISSVSSQVFWLALIFGFLYLLVSRFIVPRAESILSSRNRYVDDNIDDTKIYSEKVSNLEEVRASGLSEIAMLTQEMQHHIDQTLESYRKNQSKTLSAIIAKEKSAALDRLDVYIEDFRSNKAESTINLSAFIIKKFTDVPADMDLLKKVYKKIS
ncbi:hypothetical protein OAP56_00700 [Rickettsiaceae bacterium]|nr:hypothetical protein [Rickettsiaceae bacterium]